MNTPKCADSDRLGGGGHNATCMDATAALRLLSADKHNFGCCAWMQRNALSAGRDAAASVCGWPSRPAVDQYCRRRSDSESPTTYSQTYWTGMRSTCECIPLMESRSKTRCRRHHRGHVNRRPQCIHWTRRCGDQTRIEWSTV